MIRAATPADIPAIVEMGRKFYAATAYQAVAPFDADSVAGLAGMMIDTGVLLVADEGDLVGMVGLYVGPFMFNAGLKTAHEVMWWVDPEAQGRGVGKQLLAAIEPACRARGAVSAQMVVLESSPPQAAALYERMGYRHSETSYTKVIPWQR